MSTYTTVVRGGCHCGDVTYQIRLTFPPIPKIEAESIRIYKCNCTTCHKMGYFHCRPIRPADDFILTSPASIEELGDYRTGQKKIGFYFCKKCGVRTFAVGGEWAQDEIDVEKWAGRKGEDEDDELQKVWKTNSVDMEWEIGGKKEVKNIHYVSVNAVTLDAGEEGVDLRVWHDKDWIFYVDNRDRSGGTKMRFGEPHFGGMY